MQVELVDRLACPDCGGRLGQHTDTEAGDGELKCAGCTRHFPVVRGIPRLLPGRDEGADQRATAAHFTEEFTAVADGDRDLGDDRLNRWVFYSRTGLDPGVLRWQPDDWYPTVLPPEAPEGRGDTLAGAWVLDAGCGPGRLAKVAAPGTARLVGLDLGDHIDRAASVCAGIEEVDLVQGSVLAPPFAPETFDVVYSVGVLHHSPDPEGAVRRLAPLLRPGGRLSVWVYPPEYWGGPLRGPVNRAVHRWLRRQPPARSQAFVERVLYPLGRVQEAVAARRWTKLLLAPLFLLSVPRHPSREVMISTIMDYFGPAIVSTHAPEEVARWLRDAGLVDVEQLPVRSSATGRRPTA